MRRRSGARDDDATDGEVVAAGTRWVAWIGAIWFALLVAGFVAYAVLTPNEASSQFSSVGNFGRPIRRRGRRVQAVHDGAPASDLRDRWTKAATEEAASVTAFVDLADRLAAVGAPQVFIERCLDAAEDEVRHARICRRIARNLGAPPTSRIASSTVDAASVRLHDAGGVGRLHRGADLVRRRAELVRLGVESFVDGVVGEGIAAQHLAAGSSTALAGIDAPMRSMATDEERHAALGADIVRWCLGESPQLVGAALVVCAGQVEAAGRRAASSSPPHQDRIARIELQRAGLVDSATAAAIEAAHRAEAVAWLRHTFSAIASGGAPDDQRNLTAVAVV